MRFKSLVAFLFALAAATAALAQTKVSGTIQCKPDAVTPVAIGDRPGHAFAVFKQPCTWTKGLEIAGGQTKTGADTIMTEMTGDDSTDRGYHTSTMANGDTLWVRFQGTGKSKDGKPVSSVGTWSFIDGTGKLKGIKGKGTYKGAGNADGSSTVQVEGEYSLP